ncbi:DUF2973 domain-containing protein [Synechococcus phage S-SRM01]|uniref:DUF2973 domain-containing protein n=1 Tax=Synechococcus phage S-SRM01 TaxID=2781608 RepID=A0A879R279_9CAUD|nr:DUF2973 domain-containing protein [Synechococcus phage S-SRM01]QPX47979.1 DUF2973 domain-containing protein [Synechococcus phage S-SRM01]
MLAISLVFGSFLTILFLIMGMVIGWVGREYMMTHQEGPKQIAYHPEFYDKDGELIDQEIVSVRFEQGYFEDDFEMEEEDES